MLISAICVHTTHYIHYISILYIVYMTYIEFRYWEVIVKLRKFFIVIITFAFGNGASEDGTLWTAALGCVILIAYFVMVCYEEPFSFRRNNSLQVFTALMNILALFCGVLFFSNRFTQQSVTYLK